MISYQPAEFTRNYNQTPFGFDHTLHELGLFNNDALRSVCRVFADHPEDYFVARSAEDPATEFYSVARTELKPHEAFDQLSVGSYKILLKRLELHDRRFRDLLDSLFEEVRKRLRVGGYCEELVRLESSMFISAPWTTTPFHFDPEVNFFFQIEGEKTYHLYPPSALQEDEVEPLYVRATVDIGQVDLARRDPATEYVFRLRPGCGVHQPQDSPHWVETMGSRSVSYTLVFETTDARQRARVRSFNHYLRRLHIEPARPGVSPTRDAIKAATMAAAIPVRKKIGRAIRQLPLR